ncbi:hypothetical protein V500_08530 [Pseudogymnoascus sp. VKM F-4518 (FW-2643)]|nr:hypothetical protein V500_08530 [Pseudogymnoascus sp. VKM F-4518 (FW-2643)]
MASNTAPEGLMPAPIGVTPDFDVNHYNSTQLQFILAYSITLGFAAITLLLRLYTRIFLIQGFGLDDVFIILAIIASVAFFVVCLEIMKYGFGRHLWEVTGIQMANYLDNLIAMVTTYIWAPALTKISFLILLHRLNPIPWFRVSLYCIGAMILIYTLTINLVIAFPCSPLKPNTGDCLNDCGLWQAILNIITDFLSILLPIRMVLTLKLPTTQKAILAGIFSTSIFVVVICVVRITYIMSLANNLDVTYSQGRAAVWSCVEINIGIVCASVIVLKPFMRHHFPGVFSTYVMSVDNSDATPIKSFPRGFSESKKANPSEYQHPNTFQMARVKGDSGTNDDGSGLGQGRSSRKGSLSTTSDEMGRNGITVTKTVRMNSRTRKETRTNFLDTESTEEINAPNHSYSRA